MFCLSHIHRWDDIYKNKYYIFEGERIKKKEYTDYQICRKCGMIRYNSTYCEGGRKYKLSEEEFDVITRKLETCEFFTV